MTGIRALRILVVDDEADLVATYRRLFRRQGYVVDSAVTRAGGLALIDSAAPDLVIADLELPDGDGLDLVRAARMAPTPCLVVVVSARPSNGAREGAMEAGASAFVAKPFSAGALRDLVRSLFDDPQTCPSTRRTNQ
jgi:DNA-binding response OmpR family regulator